MGCGERPSQNCIQAVYNLSQCWHGIHDDSGREVNQSRWLFPGGRVTAVFTITNWWEERGENTLSWLSSSTDLQTPEGEKGDKPQAPGENFRDSNMHIIMIFLECFDNRVWAKFYCLNNYTTLCFFLILFLFFEPLCLQELGTALGQTWRLLVRTFSKLCFTVWMALIGEMFTLLLLGLIIRQTMRRPPPC